MSSICIMALGGGGGALLLDSVVAFHQVVYHGMVVSWCPSALFLQVMLVWAQLEPKPCVQQ